MVYIRSRKFCCCLPVRFGVFAMTLLGTFGGGALAITLWVQIHKNGTFDNGSTRDKVVAGVDAGSWTLLAIVSFFGLIGTIAKKAALVSLYATLLFINLALSVASGVFYLHNLFQADTKQRAVDKCLDGNDSTADKDGCIAGYDVARIVLIPIFCVIWLFLLYGCIIVSNYVGQLHEEEAAEDMSKTLKSMTSSHPMQTMPFAVSSQDHKPLDAQAEYDSHDSHPLVAHDHNEYPYSAYPYNAPQHSYGNR